MNRNELPAQAANIKQAVGSSATCTTATADSLKAFLLPTRSIHFQEKASAGASRCLKPKPPKAQRTRETKKSKQKTSVEVPEVSLDGPVVLHAQEKWLLATEIANITLRTLTDTIKNIPAQKADCGRPSSKSGSCSLPIRQNSDKETPVPLQPISVNRLSNLQEDQRRSRRSSSGSASNQRQGLRAQAECARIAFTALRSMHLHDDIGQDLPLLQLETGMSALIGKLIAIGFNDLATKELRILRKRLNLNIQALTGNEKSDMARTKKSLADDAPWPSKESLESLLDFHVPTDSGSLLALVVTSQLQALKLIFLLGTSDVIDASLKHLQLSSPHSPANLIELQVDKASPESNIKVTRQLESLSQLLLALCTNSSTIPGGKNGGLCRRPSPETNFGLQTAVLEIRLRQWKLLSHKNDISKEIIKPFAVYLDQFCRQSSLTPQEKYSMSRTAYERLTTSDGPTASSAPEQRWLAVYRRLADLAQECGRLDESLQWLQYAKTLFSESEIGSCGYCAISCRVINIRLGAPINTSDIGELLVSLKDACESLKGDLRGETADLDDLMTIVLISRRLAFSIIHGYQKAPPKAESRAKSEVIHYCSDLILLGLKFLVRYVSSGSRNEKASSRYNQGMQVVWNNARLFIESIAAMTRFSVASQMQNWERLESGLQDCTKLVTALTNLQYTGSTPSFSHDMKELSFIPISNAYWCRHLYLKQKGGSSQEIRGSLHIAINLLRSRPALEKLDGLLPAKLEKFGLLYEASKEYAHATDTYAEALQLLVQSSTFKAAVVACQSMCIAKVLGEPSEYSILGRLLLSYVRAASRIDHHDTDARLCFDDDTLLPGERGLLLEQQLIALSSIIHKKGASVNIRRMIQGTSALLLTIYENHEFPIRRLRVVLLSLQIRFTDPMAIEVNTAEQILEHGLQGGSMNLLQLDAGLQRFGAHLLQCRDLYLALLEVAVKTQVLEGNLMLWSTMLQDSTWESVCNQVNDVGHWILQLQFLEEYLETQGLDLLRVRTLQLITTLQELREPIEPSAALSSFSRLASQYARLGYATEAGDALQRSTKYLDSGASSDTMMSWNLAFAEVAIACGNATRALVFLFLFSSETNNQQGRIL
jgi:separase